MTSDNFTSTSVTSNSQHPKIRSRDQKCANQYGRPGRSQKSKKGKKTAKTDPPDHEEGRKAVKEDIQKQKRANTPVLCHNTGKSQE